MFMEEEEEGREVAAIVPLAQLNRMSFDSQTKSYIDEVNHYADLVLGDTWRDRGGSTNRQ